MYIYAHLGQAARCPSSSVLPPGYLDGDDVAYLPGVAPEPSAPSSKPDEAPGWPWVAAAGAVLLAWWLLR